MSDKKPTLGNGKICYLEIPSTNIEVSASFYKNIFGWTIREMGDGHVSFDDGVGEVSGMWVLDKKPMMEPGIIISIMVDDAEATKNAVTAHGGIIIDTMKTDSGEVIVHFTDPAGNFMGLYQAPA